MPRAASGRRSLSRRLGGTLVEHLLPAADQAAADRKAHLRVPALLAVPVRALAQVEAGERGDTLELHERDVGATREARVPLGGDLLSGQLERVGLADDGTRSE